MKNKLNKLKKLQMKRKYRKRYTDRRKNMGNQ